MPNVLRLTLLFLVVLSLGSRCSADNVFEVRRAKGQDAANVLYLFANHQGRDTETEKFFQSAKRVNDSPDLRTMLDSCKQIGCAATMSRLRMYELSRIKLPACVLLNLEGSTVGKWHLLAYVTSDHVGIVRGDSIIVDLVSISDFRSKWNGYTIMAADTSNTSAMALRCISLVVAFVIVIYTLQNGFAK